MSAGKFLRPLLLRSPFYLFPSRKQSCFLLKRYYSCSITYRHKFHALFSSQWSAVRQFSKMSALSPMDPSSFSRPDLALLKHVSLKLNVDFDQKVLSGEASLLFETEENVDEIILDVRDQTIKSVQLNDGTELKHTIDSEVPDFGSKLTVKLPKIVPTGEKIKIKIQYSTSPTASALQWLEPAQTSGKEHPYMFSQCQPIHARSILPCQDSPAVKFTYDASVSAPAHFAVLMSALRGASEGGVTAFSQPVPVPSYLIAIAVGVLESRRLGPRSLVWSEKAEIERSAWEFAHTEQYLAAAERLCGPYEWTQYDLLVLPPSFPYGGMENPCLTFVTPTLLAGDRSQADVIVHEIMHSWTGNLVTNRNFEHFWLNEGFTVYLERKVGASLAGSEAAASRDFHSILGLQELAETVNDDLGANNPLTQLVVDLKSIHPDDAFSTVPYEKGSLFLRYLEDLCGGPEVFDDFLRAYLEHFKRKSLDTAQFKAFLLNYFKDSGKLAQVDWDKWFFTPGMPPVIPQYNTSMTTVINKLVAKMDDSISAEAIREGAASFTPHQTIHFLQQLVDKPALSIEKLRNLGQALNLATAQNTEILYRWLRLCIRSKDESQLQNALDFVNRQGRMKYVRPIYRDLFAWEQVRQKAIDNFLKNEQYMMHVSAYTVRKDLHLTEKPVEVKV